jgi:thymidylate synthase (FAD)
MEIISPSVVIETPREHIADYMRQLEKFGRTCHKSEDKIDDSSADAFVDKYLIKLGHESVLEHCSISARFICDRSASHQLVRHRIGSFSQESQRAVDYSANGIQVICPPTIRENPDAFATWSHHVKQAELTYNALLAAGAPPEDARSVLPNCTKTEIIATFNLRQWRHIFEARALNPRAQWQIRELMADLLKQMHGLLPVVFADLQQKILYKLVFSNQGQQEEG